MGNSQAPLGLAVCSTVGDLFKFCLLGVFPSLVGNQEFSHVTGTILLTNKFDHCHTAKTLPMKIHLHVLLFFLVLRGEKSTKDPMVSSTAGCTLAFWDFSPLPVGSVLNFVLLCLQKVFDSMICLLCWLLHFLRLLQKSRSLCHYLAMHERSTPCAATLSYRAPRHQL